MMINSVATMTTTATSTPASDRADDAIATSLPRYAHAERIRIAPVVVAAAAAAADDAAAGTTRRRRTDYDVQFESSSELLVAAGSGASSTASAPVRDDDGALLSAAATASPFPIDVVRTLLLRHGCVSLAATFQNSASSDSDFAASLLHPTAPSGVSVTAEFLVDRDDDGSKKCEKAKAKDAFLSSLKELAGRHRILLAPLSSVNEPRTKKRILVEEVVGIENDRRRRRSSRIRVSIALPADGAGGTSSPVSSEGLQSFVSVLPPCGTGAGIFTLPASRRFSSNGDALAASTIWSNLLLGSYVSEGDEGPPPFDVPHDRRRGLWFRFEASPSCYDSPGSPKKNCRLGVSQGLFYSVAAQRQQQRRYNDIGGGDKADNKTSTEVYLKDVLPLARRHRDTASNEEEETTTTLFPICPFADSTTIELVLPNTKEGNGKILAGCSSTENQEIIDRNQDTGDGDDGTRIVSVPLERASRSKLLSGPCFGHATTNTKSAGSSSAAAAPPYWSVHLDIHRRSGQANRGTVIAHLSNRDPDCAAYVSFHHMLPPVLEPVWRSLAVWETTTTRNGTDNIAQQLPWTDIPTLSVRVEDREEDDNDGVSIHISLDRQRLPPSSSLELVLDYEPAFLSFESFPADPNRGFEIPPFRATFFESPECQRRRSASTTGGAGGGTGTFLFSNAALLMAPVPDMSMPFNVLSLTCTLYAFVAGALINLLVRRASERVKYTLHPKPKKESKLKLLKDRIKAKLQRLTGKAKPLEEREETAESASNPDVTDAK